MDVSECSLVPRPSLNLPAFLHTTLKAVRAALIEPSLRPGFYIETFGLLNHIIINLLNSV